MNYFFSSFYPNILGAYIITYIVLLKRDEALSIGPQLLLLLFWVHVNLQVCLRLDDREIEPGVWYATIFFTFGHSHNHASYKYRLRAAQKRC